MMIDLSKITSGYSFSERDDYKLKSGKLYNYIKKINYNMCKKYNFVIVPISIYNIIEHDDRFEPVPILSDDLRLIRVGFLGHLEFYLNIYSPPDQIIVSWDKQTARDIKIENLLNGTDIKEKIIKIL